MKLQDQNDTAFLQKTQLRQDQSSFDKGPYSAAYIQNKQFINLFKRYKTFKTDCLHMHMYILFGQILVMIWMIYNRTSIEGSRFKLWVLAR